MPTRLRKEKIKLPALFVSNADSINSGTRGAWKPKLDAGCAGPTCRNHTVELASTTHSEDADSEMRLPVIATAHSTRNLTVESATTWSTTRRLDSGRTARIGAACGGPDVAFMVRNNRHVRLDHLQALDIAASVQCARKRKLIAMSDADGRGSPGWSKRNPLETPSPALRRPTSADSDYDIDSETLCYSLTLPTIEAVLTEEGISSHSISQQMAQIRERCRRWVNLGLSVCLCVVVVVIIIITTTKQYLYHHVPSHHHHHHHPTTPPLSPPPLLSPPPPPPPPPHHHHHHHYHCHYHCR